MSLITELTNYAKENYHTTDLNSLGIISGKEWKYNLNDIPDDLRGGDDFTMYCSQVKPDDVYNGFICSDTIADPSGYEVNQYPKPLTLGRAKIIMYKTAHARHLN